MSKTLIIVLLVCAVGFLVVFFNRKAWFGDKPKTRITRESATVIARDVVAREKGEFILEEDKTLEREFGWVFFYAPKKYLETKSINDLIPGVAPFVVTDTGNVVKLTSSMPPEQAIEDYARRVKGGSHFKIKAVDPYIMHVDGRWFSAQNNPEYPSLVVAGTGEDVILWEKELVLPKLDPKLERDVQLAPYFVAGIKVSPKNSKNIVVTLGTGIDARTYTLDRETGEVVDIGTINPPPASAE